MDMRVESKRAVCTHKRISLAIGITLGPLIQTLQMWQKAAHIDRALLRDLAPVAIL